MTDNSIQFGHTGQPVTVNSSDLADSWLIAINVVEPDRSKYWFLLEISETTHANNTGEAATGRNVRARFLSPRGVQTTTSKQLRDFIVGVFDDLEAQSGCFKYSIFRWKPETFIDSLARFQDPGQLQFLTMYGYILRVIISNVKITYYLQMVPEYDCPEPAELVVVASWEGDVDRNKWIDTYSCREVAEGLRGNLQHRQGT